MLEVESKEQPDRYGDMCEAIGVRVRNICKRDNALKVADQSAALLKSLFNHAGAIFD